MKKKILIISETMSGGVRRHLVDILENIDLEKFEVYLFYSPNRVDEIFKSKIKELSKRINLIESKDFYKSMNLKNDIKTFKKISEIIKKIKPDVVHCHSSKAGILGRIAAKKNKVEKIIYTPHAYYFENVDMSKIKYEICRGIEELLSKCCTTKSFNVSDGERNFAIKNRIDKEEKFVTIYNGVPDDVLPKKEDIKKQLGYKETDLLIGVAARLNEQKDPMCFIEIAKKVIEDNRDKQIYFIYIGEGPLLNNVRNYLKKYKLEDKVNMLGFRKDADKIIVGLDFYLMTSIYEGLPYAAIEATRAGVPIVATDVIGNNEVVKKGINGLLFQKSNPTEGAEILNGIIKNNEFKYENIRKIYYEEFHIERMMDKIQKEYM